MKRLLLSLLAASALALSMGSVASAEDGVIYKFECADITGGGGQLVDEDEPATAPFDFGFNLEAATKCGGMVYTLHVYADEAGCLAKDPANELATLIERGASLAPNGINGQVVFLAPDLTTDTEVWVYATTSKGKADGDIAPDPIDGCLDVSIFPPSSGKFR
jgi:hypothetical protein